MKNTKADIASILRFEANESELKTTLSSNTMDWEWFVKASSLQGVLTTAYCRLAQKGLLELLPNDLSKYLKELTTINRNRNQSLLNQIKTISVLFNTHGIHHVFVKGCALLASGYYNDYGERLIGDIDILVDLKHIYKAECVLKDANYNSQEQTLFGKYKDHRHLPRLTHPEHLGAVEIHSKLLRKEKQNLLSVNTILENQKIINGVSVPSIKHNLDILILNHQINDFGYAFKSIDLKVCYDSFVLEHQQTETNTFRISKYHRLFYMLRALYFESSTKDAIKTTTVLKTIYTFINKNKISRRIYTRLVKLNIRLMTCLVGMKLFVKNKDFRADVWSHKAEVIQLLKSDDLV